MQTKNLACMGQTETCDKYKDTECTLINEEAATLPFDISNQE